MNPRIAQERRWQSGGVEITGRIYHHAANVVSAKQQAMEAENEAARVTTVRPTAKVLPFPVKRYCPTCGSRLSPTGDVCLSCSLPGGGAA